MGINTVIKDNPLLNVRLVKGRNPKKIIIDSSLRISAKQNIFRLKNEQDIFIVTSIDSKKKVKKIDTLEKVGAKILFVKRDYKGNLNLKSILKKLAKEKITSVLVEGGSKVFNSFINQKLFDEILLFVCPKIFGKGLSWTGNSNISKAMNFEIVKSKKIDNDILLKIKKRGR